MIFNLPLKLNFKSIHFSGETYFKAHQALNKMRDFFGVNLDRLKALEMYRSLIGAQCWFYHFQSSLILPSLILPAG